MPAINVARTDTFEVQRQKINQIGEILSNISAGGSDLQTGNLKLGDGTQTVPSLSFISDSSLGFYKSDVGTFGIVNNDKKIIDFAPSSTISYKDFIVQKKSLNTEGIAILSAGNNYDQGSFTGIFLIGGTGENATVDLQVTAYNGSITQTGTGYLSGTFTSVLLEGGSGTGAEVGFSVTELQVSITNAGTGYTYDTNTFGVYEDVPLITVSGSGSGAVATFVVEEENGSVISVSITNSGSGYNVNDTLSASNIYFGGTGSGLQLTVNQQSGDIYNFDFVEKGDGYQVGDVLVLSTGSTGVTAQLSGSVVGVSTILSDLDPIITVTSTAGILQGMSVTQQITEDPGAIASDTFVQSVDSSTQITLSQTPTIAGAATLDFSSTGDLNTIPVSSTNGIFTGSILQQTSGSGSIAPDTTVTSVDSELNVVVVNNQPTLAGSAVLSFIPPYGNTPSQSFQYTINQVGVIEDVSISDGGNGYSVGDLLSVNPSDLTNDINILVTNKSLIEITFTGSISATAFSIGDVLTIKDDQTGEELIVEYINSSGSNLVSLYTSVPILTLSGSEILLKQGTSAPEYNLNTFTGTFYRWYLDTGSGPVIAPDLDLYVGNNYLFDLSDASNNSHSFALSKYSGGIWGDSYITGISANLDTNTNQITVSNPTGIQIGMEVTFESGTGSLVIGTTVSDINGSVITLSNSPLETGTATLSFRGVAYTDGVTDLGTSIRLKVTESTPTLYYYCAIGDVEHANEANDAVITINPNNPKIFGSGFSLSVGALDIFELIKGDVVTGDFNSIRFVGSSALIDSGSFPVSLSTNALTANSLTLNSISAAVDNIELAASSFVINSDINIANLLSVTQSDGNLTTSGSLKTLNSLNVNDSLIITNNNIQATAGLDVLISPPTGRVAKVNSTSALTIPSGNTAERPVSGVRASGSIRFNTQTNQYEGYSDINGSWSSLGGVRDLDGNTTILAEESVGANDNTLWFINDNVNTVRFTREYQEFVNVKKIRSLNVAAPTYTNYVSNFPVAQDSYLKYRNNIYKVTASGTTATSGNEPTDTTGVPFTNGSAELVWYSTAVSSLTFEEISEVRIDPLGFTDFVVNNELRFSNNKISSTINDIIIEPVGSQKVKVNSASSLVIPVGDSNSKGNPEQGSIRYNTTDAQFEGFNGSQWGGLGGVKDVDQDTKIEAETGPGNDEDILYFFNAGNNTLRLTTTKLEFDSIDTIQSSGSNELNIDAALVTFDNLSTTIDNTDGDTTLISSTRDSLDFGLATGLNNDHLLRLTNTGQIVYNLGFGTGTSNNLTLLNNTLTTFELAKTKINTRVVTLIKGTSNAANATVYSKTIEDSAKVFLTAVNITTGDKEIIEFFVTDKGSDIYFTDSNNVKTGEELVSVGFDVDPSNNVRLTVTAGNIVAAGNQIQVTIVNTVTKR